MHLFNSCYLSSQSVWPDKNCQMSIKVAQNDFTRKMNYLYTFTKIALECGGFGQINCFQRLWMVAQSAINRPIWSHCSQCIIPCSFQSLERRMLDLRWSRQTMRKTVSKPIPILSNNCFLLKIIFSFVILITTNCCSSNIKTCHALNSKQQNLVQVRYSSTKVVQMVSGLFK